MDMDSRGSSVGVGGLWEGSCERLCERPCETSQGGCAKGRARGCVGDQLLRRTPYPSPLQAPTAKKQPGKPHPAAPHLWRPQPPRGPAWR